MPRKDIELSDEHCRELDRLRGERKATYSQLISAALTQWLARDVEVIQQQAVVDRLTALEGLVQDSLQLLLVVAERLEHLTPMVQAPDEVRDALPEGEGWYRPSDAPEEDRWRGVAEGPAAVQTSGGRRARWRVWRRQG